MRCSDLLNPPPKAVSALKWYRLTRSLIKYERINPVLIS
jgi:hypothetical protein